MEADSTIPRSQIQLHTNHIKKNFEDDCGTICPEQIKLFDTILICDLYKKIFTLDTWKIKLFKPYLNNRFSFRKALSSEVFVLHYVQRPFFLIKTVLASI